MSRERWGTFSVIDHIRPQAFVAEVLLYDHLVIPVPPNDDERKRWRDPSYGWDPDRQESLMKVMGDLVVRVPWDFPKQVVFNTKHKLAQGVGVDTNHILDFKSSGASDPYAITREMLGNEFRPPLPDGVTKVWALPAYPSVNEYQTEVLSEKQKKREQLALVLTHRFFVPKKTMESDIDMLEKATALAKRDDFKDKRAKFHQWQEKIIEDEVPDEKAVEEMDQYLRDFERVANKAKIDVYWKYAFMVIPAALGVATAALGLPLVLAGANGFVSIMQFAKFDSKPKIDAGECEAAAMIHDIREEMKWS